MASEVQSGSQTATISTRHQLGTTITTSGNYVLHVEIVNMADGSSTDAMDELLLEVEEKVRFGDTSRVCKAATFRGAPGIEKIAIMDPICCIHSLSFFLTQTAGVGRAYSWSIRKVEV